ncbi:MAG: tetratricopeptide repeat protein, partial [Bacteroidales bacterium]|nr:tetratricopeptide repeat protein [Bacteroidales bacterium]
MKKTGLLVLALLCTIILSAQTALKKAINSYEREQYYACIKSLEPLASTKRYSDEVKAEVNFYLGLSYLRLSNPAQAISYFNKSISLNNNIPEAFLYLGESMQMMEHYEEAEKFYSHFLELKPKDSIGLLKVESLNYCKKMLRNPSAYKVRIMPSFNTVEMDYSPFFDGKDFRSVYFTSSRYYENKAKTNKESGEPYSNIYVSTISKDGFWSFPKKIEGQVNTDYDEGTASINRNSKNLYFTRCTYNKNKDRACRIYMARKSSNFWTKAELIEIRGLPDNISVGHPCISPDELSLYFVADSMLGGYGGKDIYKITRAKRSDAWGGMQNLGPDVNTRGDESYPYIRYDGTLYFASNGHLGMGGYDI